jgi:hypothetical protein
MPGNDQLSQLVRDEIRMHLVRHRGTQAGTQAWLAEEAGITQKHLSQVMRAHVGVNVKLAERLLEKIGRTLIVGSTSLPYDTEDARLDDRCAV